MGIGGASKTGRMFNSIRTECSLKLSVKAVWRNHILGSGLYVKFVLPCSLHMIVSSFVTVINLWSEGFIQRIWALQGDKGLDREIPERRTEPGRPAGNRGIPERRPAPGRPGGPVEHLAVVSCTSRSCRHRAPLLP